MRKILRLRHMGCNNYRRYSTIYALSSGQGKCGVAVIRISGEKAAEAVLRMTRSKKLPEARKARLTAIVEPKCGDVIDRGLVLWFPGPNSFTGENCCELQVHGGPAIVDAVLAGLSSLPTYRPAAPGEFTRRAFLAGRMDLTQVEGLADLIHAETEQQRRQALLQMDGSLALLYGKWRASLIKCVAHVEAYIDFSEEENIEEDVLALTRTTLKVLADEVKQHLQDGRRGEILKNGVRTAIVGEPNVGKSSLFNLLVGRSASIVTPIAGTTRDIVTVTVNVGGFPLMLADTAGMRDDTESGEVEREGIRRARVWADQADLTIVVIDATKIADFHYDGSKEKYKLKISQEVPSLFVINKIDVLSVEDKCKLREAVGEDLVCISCDSGEGVTDMLHVLATNLETLCGSPSREMPYLTQARHRHHLVACGQHLDQCMVYCDQETTLLLAAHSARKALRELGHITGNVTTEHLLDVIFADFCIGK